MKFQRRAKGDPKEQGRKTQNQKSSKRWKFYLVSSGAVRSNLEEQKVWKIKRNQSPAQPIVHSDCSQAKNLLKFQIFKSKYKF